MIDRSATARSDITILLMLIGVVVGVGTFVLGPKPAVVAVGVPLAVMAAVYAVRRPVVVLVAMVAVEVTNLSGVAEDNGFAPTVEILSFFHISLVLGVMTVFLALRNPVMRGRLNRWTLVFIGLIACYLVTQLVAAFTSQNVGSSMATVGGAVRDCVFLVVVLVLSQLSGKPWTVAAAVVLPLAVLSLLCLVSQVGFGGTAEFGGFATITEATGEQITTLRYGGPLPDSNFWGRHLIMGLPLAGALIVRAVRSGRRGEAAGWVVALLALLVGVYLTQSRGALICTAVVFLVWMLASGPDARRRGLTSIPVIALVFLIPGIGNRLLALVVDVSGSQPNYSVDPSVLQRANAQEVAWTMFHDRPIFGFGPGVFPQWVSHYAGMVPTAVLQPTDAPHNLYAELAAESGILGLVGWAIFLGGFILLITIRVAQLALDPVNSDRSLAAAVLAALVGWSVASIFLHLASFRTLAIVLALAGALACEAGPRFSRVATRRPAITREMLLGTVLGAAVTGIIVFATTEHAHTVSQKVILQPAAQVTDYYAYAIDTKSREVVLPTYASMMSDGDRVTAVADPVRGVISIRVPYLDSRAVSTDLDQALMTARVRLRDFGADSWYTVEPIGPIEYHTVATRSQFWTATGVLAGIVVGAGTVLILRRRTVGLLGQRQRGTAVHTAIRINKPRQTMAAPERSQPW